MASLRDKYKRSSIPSGGIGIFSATSLSSPAASSLDKPAGTLSAKSTADIAAAGQAAQTLLNNIPREITKEYTVGARSFAYMAGLMAADSLLKAESELITKYVAQATPQQQLQLLRESGKQGVGLQRAIAERIAETNQMEVTEKGEFNLPLGLLIIGALIVLGGIK